MKYILKNSSKVIGIKIAMNFISVCMIIAFTWLFNITGGFIIYSTLTTLILFAWLFSEGKSVGRKFTAKEKGPYYGFLCAAVAEIPSLILILLLLVLKSIFMMLNITYWLYNAAFMGFFSFSEKLMLMTRINIFYIFPLIIIPVAYGMGYYFGFNKIEINLNLLERLIYKKED